MKVENRTKRKKSEVAETPIPALKSEEIRFSVYNGVRDVRGVQVSLTSILKRIETGASGLADRITRLRGMSAEAYAKTKTQLPAVTFGGTFDGGHKAQNLKTHSGLLVLDLDDIEVNSLDDLKARLLAFPFVCLLFISPSGAGLKAVVRLDGAPANPAEHTAAYNTVATAMAAADITVDPSGKDVSRLCFLSHDPFLIWRPNATPFEWKTAEKKPNAVCNRARIRECPPHSEWEGEVDLKALDFIDPDHSYERWYQVGMACKTAGLAVAVWDNWSASGEKYKAGECEKKWDSFDSGGRITWGTVVLWAKEGGYHPERKTARARLPVLVKEKTEGETQTCAVLSVVRAQLTENLRCWLREEGAHRRFLLLSHDTGVGKTYAVISETDSLFMVSPHSELTDEHYRRAADFGNEAFRWRGRAFGFQAVLDNVGLQWGGIPGRRRPELEDACFELASDGRARAMCAYADVANVMARRGYHLGRDLCSLCPPIERCRQVGYLSQERAANASAQVFISYPELDILFDETRAPFVERLCSFYKDRTAVIDDCNPAQLSPRREVSLSLITALFKERTEDWVRDAKKSGTTVHFAPALSTAFLKDLQSLLQTGTKPNRAVANLQDTYNLSDVREELSAIPIYIVVSDGQVEDARTGRVLDSDRFKNERVRDGLHRVFFKPRDARRLRLVNDRDLPRVVDRESGFVAAMLENAPVRRKETGGPPAWEFLLKPHLILKNYIALSATARAEDFRNVLGPNVDFKAIAGSPPRWMAGCKVYQLDRATYTERSYFQREGGEITGPGARLLDVFSLISKEASAGRRVLLVGRKALTEKPISETSHPVENRQGVAIRNYGELVGVNEFSDFDTVFLMLPYPGREEIENTAAAVYRGDFETLDLETRAAGTVRAGGFSLDMQTYTDERVQAIAEGLIREKLYQAAMRLRPNLNPDKAIVLLTAFPVAGLTDRPDTVFFSFDEALAADSVREIKPTETIADGLARGLSIAEVARRAGVSERTVYRAKGKVDKTERDKTIREMGAEGKSLRAISKALQVSRDTVARVLKKT